MNDVPDELLTFSPSPSFVIRRRPPIYFTSGVHAFFKRQFAARVSIQIKLVPWANVAVEKHQSESILNFFLDQALQWPGSIDRVVAFPCQLLDGLWSHFQFKFFLARIFPSCFSCSCTIPLIKSGASRWKTIMSSMRLRNSGRNVRRNASISWGIADSRSPEDSLMA